MRPRTLLLTTMLTSALALGTGAAQAADTITSNTVTTAGSPITEAAMKDPRVAATSFVEHVNYARVAIAMKNTDLAKQHIVQARNMVTVIKSATVEQRHITEVESGRIAYKYDTKYKYHYFPIQTGPVQIKQIDNGPAWAKNDLAVSDAEMVYLTLDLRGDTAEDHLTAAEEAVADNDLKSAEDHLAELTDSVVKVDNKISMPNVKARDNIALARHFIVGENYEGATYALNHADDALDEMQKDDLNKKRLKEISTMRNDVKTLQDHIAKHDPSMMKKFGTKIDTWWNDLNNWVKSGK